MNRATKRLFSLDSARQDRFGNSLKLFSESEDNGTTENILGFDVTKVDEDEFKVTDPESGEVAVVKLNKDQIELCDEETPEVKTETFCEAGDVCTYEGVDCTITDNKIGEDGMIEVTCDGETKRVDPNACTYKAKEVLCHAGDSAKLDGVDCKVTSDVDAEGNCTIECNGETKTVKASTLMFSDKEDVICIGTNGGKIFVDLNSKSGAEAWKDHSKSMGATVIYCGTNMDAAKKCADKAGYTGGFFNQHMFSDASVEDKVIEAIGDAITADPKLADTLAEAIPGVNTEELVQAAKTFSSKKRLFSDVQTPAAPEVGKSVTFELFANQVTGKVIAIEGDMATIKIDATSVDVEEVKMPISKLSVKKTYSDEVEETKDAMQEVTKVEETEVKPVIDPSTDVKVDQDKLEGDKKVFSFDSSSKSNSGKFSRITKLISKK